MSHFLLQLILFYHCILYIWDSSWPTIKMTKIVMLPHIILQENYQIVTNFMTQKHVQETNLETNFINRD